MLVTSGAFSSPVIVSTLDECKAFVGIEGIKTIIAEYTPGILSPYKCIGYSACGTLVKDCDKITYVLSSESLTPSTVP